MILTTPATILEPTPSKNSSVPVKSHKLLYNPNVKKEIKNIMDFGLFLNLSKGEDGFVPAQMASKDFVKNLKDKFKVGDVVKAQIVEIDKEKQRIKLSIRAV